MEDILNKEKATLIKVLSVKREVANNKKIDSVLIFYRDENGVKKSKFVERAELPYYILKDKTSEEAQTQPIFIEADKVEKRVAYSDSIYREIAIQTNSLMFYDKILLSRGEGSNDMKNLFKHPYLYDCDMEVEDRYIRKFHDEHEINPEYTLHKTYFDIEVDIMGFNGFPDEEIAPCPFKYCNYYRR